MKKENLKERKSRLNQNLQHWKEEKPILMAEQDLQEDKEITKDRKKIAKKDISTTKFLMIFLFLSCTIIEVFTLCITVYCVLHNEFNFTPLQMLITAVVGEVVSFAIYSVKASKENTKGGIVYDTAMFDRESQIYDTAMLGRESQCTNTAEPYINSTNIQEAEG